MTSMSAAAVAAAATSGGAAAAQAAVAESTPVPAGPVGIAIAQTSSPVGTLLLAATDDGIVRLACGNEDREQVIAQLTSAIGPIDDDPASARVQHVEAAIRELDAFFDGSLRDFTVPIDQRLSSGFRLAAQQALLTIPFGERVSYRELAERAGNPNAFRAAATGCATNPIPILVPCHRVVRTDGRIGDYRGGTEAKRLLLDLESGGDLENREAGQRHENTDGDRP